MSETAQIVFILFLSLEDFCSVTILRIEGRAVFCYNSRKSPTQATESYEKTGVYHSAKENLACWLSKNAGTVSTLVYGEKSLLLYSPIKATDRILYLIHGGGGDQRSFFCPEFLNMIDHMIDSSILDPLYIVSPCFYDPAEKDKSPASSGIAVKKFCKELREQIIPSYIEIILMLERQKL